MFPLAEARGAESRADFVHKLGIVQKELDETSVWLRILLKTVDEKQEKIVAVLVENQELCRIVGASVRTVRAGRPKETTANEVSRSIDNK